MNRHLSWGYISEDGIVEFRIYRSTSSSFSPSASTLLTVVPPTETSYNDSVNDDYITYYYIVEAIRPNDTLITDVIVSEAKEEDVVISINKPIITEVTYQFDTVTITTTPFSADGDQHLSTDWVLVRDDNRYTQYSYVDEENLETKDLLLDESGIYFIAARYNGNVGYSEWSDWYELDYTFVGPPILDLGTFDTLSVVPGSNKLISFSRSDGYVYVVTSHEPGFGDRTYLDRFKPITNISQVKANGMSVDNTGIYLGRWGTVSGNGRTLVEKHSYTDGELLNSYASLYGAGGATSSAQHPYVVELGMDGFLYVGTRSNYIHKINKENNSLIWTIQPATFSIANDIKMDSEGNLYVASSEKLFKIDPVIGVTKSGWPIEVDGGFIYSICIDENNNVYTASGSIISKLDSSGNVLWTYDHGSTLTYIIVDSNTDIVYYASTDNTVNSLRLVGGEPYKTKLHTRHTLSPSALVIDKLGNLYSASPDRTIVRYRPDLFQSDVIIPSPDW